MNQLNSNATSNSISSNDWRFSNVSNQNIRERASHPIILILPKQFDTSQQYDSLLETSEGFSTAR